MSETHRDLQTPFSQWFRQISPEGCSPSSRSPRKAAPGLPTAVLPCALWEPVQKP